MVLQHKLFFSYLLYLCLWDHSGVAPFWFRKCLPATSTRVCCGVEGGKEVPFPGGLASAPLTIQTMRASADFSTIMVVTGAAVTMLRLQYPFLSFPCPPLLVPICPPSDVPDFFVCWAGDPLLSCPTCKFKMRNKGISSLCHNAGILILVIFGFVFIDIFFFILGHIFLLCMPGHFLLDVNFTLLGVGVLSVCIFFVLECSHLETLCSFQDLLLNFARAAFSLGLPLSVTEAVSV